MKRTLLLAVLAAAAACRDAASPEVHSPTLRPALSASASAITLDQQNGALDLQEPWDLGNGQTGTHIGKGFDPVNPHVGDAIIATFFWFGSTNSIVQVTDHLSDANHTPVGNSYQLVEYVTSGGISMATYIATNVQGFPDADTTGQNILAVHAIFSEQVTGGVKISAWRGVNAIAADAVAAHRSASGAAATTATVSPGAVPFGAGSLVYTIAMANAVVPSEPPAGFTSIGGSGSNTTMKQDGLYLVADAPGSVDPQWSWSFTSLSAWLATAVTLNPTERFVFTVQPSKTLPLVPITPAVTVAVMDANGNALTTFSGAVTIAIGHNGGLLVPGTLTGTTTVNAVNGVATFSDLRIDQLGNGYTLTVSATGVTGAESAPFNIGVL